MFSALALGYFVPMMGVALSILAHGVGRTARSRIACIVGGVLSMVAPAVLNDYPDKHHVRCWLGGAGVLLAALAAVFVPRRAS